MALAAVYVPLILAGGVLMSEPLFAALMVGALVAAVQLRAIRPPVALGGARGRARGPRDPHARQRRDPAAAAGARRVGRPTAVARGGVCRTRRARRGRRAHRRAVDGPQRRGAARVRPGQHAARHRARGDVHNEARADTRSPASWRSLRRVPKAQYLVRTPAWRRTREATLEKRLRAVAVDFIAHHPRHAPWAATPGGARPPPAGRGRATLLNGQRQPGWADAGAALSGCSCSRRSPAR